MKSIILNRATVDNAGGYCDAGAELVIGDKAEASTITAARAKELVDSSGAAAVPAAKSAG